MNTSQMNSAKESLVTWLQQPEELGKMPNKIEWAGEFDMLGVHYYIFRFRKYFFGKWMVGVCGGYREDEAEHCGHVGSEYQRYNEDTAENDCAYLVERMIKSRKKISKKAVNKGDNKAGAESIKQTKTVKPEVTDKHFSGKSDEFVVVEKLGVRGYKMKYPSECKTIWKELVAKSGPCEFVQGELLRQMEKLRYEACENGNINWDDDFIYFCDYISGTLTGSLLFDKARCKVIRGCLLYIKENGAYATKVREAVIPEDEVDVFRIAYVHEDLYDYIEDAIAEFYIKNEEMIPYKKPDNVVR